MQLFDDWDDDDKPKDECGVFSVFGHPQAAELTYLGLRALQHRGQESAGIVVSDSESFSYHHAMGLVADIFNTDILAKLSGEMAIGHNRYSTAGSSKIENAQPLVRQYKRGPLAIAHNGNLINAFRIRSDLEESGSIFSSTSDTEVIAHLIAQSRHVLLEDRIMDALREVRGAYSLIFMGKSIMVGVRDPHAFRPLWLGRLDQAYVLASETCAFDVIEAEPIREVAPGEMVVITSIDEEPKSFFIGSAELELSQCIFEYIYLARPDSIVFDQLVNRPRREFGRQLARECPVDADIVIPVPDSATIAAIGYSEELGIPFEFGLHRNPYVGRTFMNPSQEIRDLMVRVKLNPVRNVLEGKRVIVVDDSIMRGTNSRKIVKLIREEGGAKEVHFRVSSPPNKYPCFYGIDTPTRKELIANSWSVEEIQKYIEADSLGYLSIEGMLKCVKSPQNFCTACFDGDYPIEFSGQPGKQLAIEFEVRSL
ncbi:TPA: amidophosphoribosyltransferase [Candidatus Poribacteria bacterium]|nr:amidophosphoribosyltransferase [Candidatus Poribacteria bacterium]HIB86356.1 amidophosphoribosyltransferase [Candidatus Poribacteria bacterium]HIB99859.1 amidophosphoribosyltransferase [Candidatus Poribacteria bacterium]HIO05727.1 amidophosphoribosyltransferase [Candidatus Poribacteria bacterium]HIO50894.1 amidophosphoribosyltransferase [Candidatus Poribacteria bacterium]